MRYDSIILVATEPVSELQPSSEQLQRLARVLYPVIAEYYAYESEDKQKSTDTLNGGDKTVA